MIARSLFKPTGLPQTIARLGFVQADPMRAPARAQDLILAHRVKDYRAGDLERRYPRLAVEETFFFNYGFLPRETLTLLYPRTAQREAGTRVYQAIEHAPQDDSPKARLVRAGQLLDIVVQLYAPLPATTLGYLCGLLRYGVPHLAAETRQLQEHARSRYSHTEVDGVLWFWPQDEKPVAAGHSVDSKLRFLAPFDPVVWDRRRFRLFWGWEYKLEAYVPAHKRRMGHYAMPMLWGEQMPGWANLKVVDGRLQHQLGFACSRPRGRAFQLALDEALQQMQAFLEL